jgi:sporulation-control protein
MVFKSFLASLGVGAAKIDLLLTSDHITMGEHVDGKIVMMGGNVEQKIEGLFVDFKLSSRFSKGDQTIFVNEIVQRITVFKDHFVIQP